MPTLIDSDECSASQRKSVPTPTPPTFDQITENQDKSGLVLPTAENIRAAYGAWSHMEEIRTRKEFFDALPAFRKAVITLIKSCYHRDPSYDRTDTIPHAIGIRQDLLNSEIIAWLSERGWDSSYTMENGYAAYLRVTMPSQSAQAHKNPEL
jgi:hypothetical protein